MSQFVTVAISEGWKHNFSDLCQECKGVRTLIIIIPKPCCHCHSSPSRGFPCTSFLFIIIHIHTHICVYHSNNAKMDTNSTSHIHVQSAQGYFPMYKERVLRVIWLNIPRQGIDHKLRQQNHRNSSPSQFVILSLFVKRPNFVDCSPRERIQWQWESVIGTKQNSTVQFGHNSDQ